MSSHADILEQPEPLARPFWGSMFLHVGIAAAILAYGWISSKSPVKWGDEHGGGFGAVAVTAVSSIKLPSEEARPNPVANPTESQIPEPPSSKKRVEKFKAPDRDAIPIKSRNANKKVVERSSAAPNKFNDAQTYKPNQVFSDGGAKASSPMYAMQGGGGLTVGTDSPFGTQFGYYAKLLRDQVARHWTTSDFDTRQNVPPAIVTFIVRRDGSIAPGSVKLTQKSGNYALDSSAQRAILDAAPFQQLPAGFNKNEAEVELRFNLK
jgi:protein TonB